MQYESRRKITAEFKAKNAFHMEEGFFPQAALVFTQEVPENALREILYNAIAHKDYMGAPIQMRVWDDSIEIWNEGVLPEGYTSETLMEKHSSHPRNKNVAYAFFKAGFIESWGRGYQKIREGFERAGLPVPKVETTEGGVRVTFNPHFRKNFFFNR